MIACRNFLPQTPSKQVAASRSVDVDAYPSFSLAVLMVPASPQTLTATSEVLDQLPKRRFHSYQPSNSASIFVDSKPSEPQCTQLHSNTLFRDLMSRPR